VTENVTTTRRRNMLALYQDYAREHLARGESAKGLEQAFAAALEISPSTWSQIKSARPIGDRLARQIEQHAGVPAGWLDEDRAEEQAPDAAEERFVELARQAWRAANAKGKRELARALKQSLPTSSAP
jgi:transcriptional regulator with XRE-family HTH domain